MNQDVDDAQLVSHAQQNREAFGALYERYVDKIYTYIFYRTGNPAEAEDLTARVFMRALQKIDDYEDRGYAFSSWLYRIAHNLVANWYRDNSRRATITLEDLSHWEAAGNGPEDVAALLEDRATLLQAVRQLPADRQELLRLKFLDQLSNAEIGEVMGRSEGAIKSLYHRTLQTLRQDLQPEPAQPADGTRRPWRTLLWRGADKKP